MPTGQAAVKPRGRVDLGLRHRYEAWPSLMSSLGRAYIAFGRVLQLTTIAADGELPGVVLLDAPDAVSRGVVPLEHAPLRTEQEIVPRVIACARVAALRVMNRRAGSRST